MADSDEILFEVETPLGFRVRVTGEGFLITAYPTDAVKEGERIWRK